MYTVFFKKILLPVITISILACCSTNSSNIPSANYSTIVFEDNFSGSGIDDSNWYCTQQGLNYNNEDQAYITDQVSISSGELRLTAEKKTWSGDTGRTDIPGQITQSYVSGEINTTQSWKYGKFEVCAKVPSNNQGILSAIWLTPFDKSWPPEIDIVEVLGHEPSTAYFTNHYGTNSNHKMNSGQKTNLSLANGFHVYSIVWTEISITWLIDNNEYYKITGNIPDKPMILRLSLPVGPDWEGDPNESSLFPQSFIIDWVKIYQ
jgi:beta-glucanase (GH16 family)